MFGTTGQRILQHLLGVFTLEMTAFSEEKYILVTIIYVFFFYNLGTLIQERSQHWESEQYCYLKYNSTDCLF